jgi:hypothetical protein
MALLSKYLGRKKANISWANINDSLHQYCIRLNKYSEILN